MRVVSRWCRCVVQRLCATDCKHPCLVRAAAPHSAPARMSGVYAQRLCTMQSQQSIHSPSPRGRGLGIGIENLLYFYKYRLFLQTETSRFSTGGFLLHLYYSESVCNRAYKNYCRKYGTKIFYHEIEYLLSLESAVFRSHFFFNLLHAHNS